jgi:hypothetical protein
LENHALRLIKRGAALSTDYATFEEMIEYLNGLACAASPRGRRVREPNLAATSRASDNPDDRWMATLARVLDGATETLTQGLRRS